MIGLPAADADTDTPCPNCHSTRLVCRCITIGEAARNSRPPERIQRRRTKGWRMPAGAIYVGRPSRWGNEFRVGDLHPYHGWPMSPAEAVACYSLVMGADDPYARLDFKAEVRKHLAGHDLVCWCPVGEPCHGDVLLRIANA